MRSLGRIAAVILLAAAVAGISQMAAGESIGCYSMPSRFSQYLGYGYGAGHHAPIVRTPAQHPYQAPRNVRSYGPLYPAPYAPIGCYGQTCYPAPALYPTPAPVVAPGDDRQAWRLPSP